MLRTALTLLRKLKYTLRKCLRGGLPAGFVWSAFSCLVLVPVGTQQHMSRSLLRIHLRFAVSIEVADRLPRLAKLLIDTRGVKVGIREV